MAVQLPNASLWVPAEAAGAGTAGATTSAVETAGVPVPHVAIVLLRRLPAVPAAADDHAVPDDRLR